MSFSSILFFVVSLNITSTFPKEMRGNFERRNDFTQIFFQFIGVEFVFIIQRNACFHASFNFFTISIKNSSCFKKKICPDHKFMIGTNFIISLSRQNFYLLLLRIFLIAFKLGGNPNHNAIHYGNKEDPQSCSEKHSANYCSSHAVSCRRTCAACHCQR